MEFVSLSELCVNVAYSGEGLTGSQGCRRSLALLFPRPWSNPGSPPQEPWADPGSWEASLAADEFLRGVSGLSCPRESSKDILY